MPLLHYRAGPAALRRLHQHGLAPETLRALVLPATGPKWLVAAGFDRALIRGGWLARRKQRVLLLGASAGAWRALALATPNPEHALDTLVAGYCEQHFTHDDDPQAISCAYRALLASVFSDADCEHILAHPDIDVTITAVRLRAALRMRGGQTLGLAAAAALNPLHSRAVELGFERTLFHTRPAGPDAHPLLAQLRGHRHPLTTKNLRAAALASGSVPLYMQPVRGIGDAPEHGFLDGGLTDYHLRQTLRTPDGIVALFLHQARIVPNWFDKFAPWRSLPAAATQDLLLIHPDPSFVRSLPGGAIPTRDDFKTSMLEPGPRIERWKQVAAASDALGQAFEQDARSGQLAATVVPL
ncbi:MAG TPA: patatin-like phospholipase family protein [Polyangiales bacterium]